MMITTIIVTVLLITGYKTYIYRFLLLLFYYLEVVLAILKDLLLPLFSFTKGYLDIVRS